MTARFPVGDSLSSPIRRESKMLQQNQKTSAGGVSIFTADTQPPVGTALPLHGVVR